VSMLQKRAVDLVVFLFVICVGARTVRDRALHLYPYLCNRFAISNQVLN
jgi:hypothetical protein